MDVAEVDYALPAAAIAQVPAEPRDAARLLVDGGPGSVPRHAHVRDLPGLVRPGDVVVINTTRVLPARLRLTKATGAAVEVLLLEPPDAAEPGRWEALVRPSRKVPAGTTLSPGPGLTVRVGDDLGDGLRLVDLEVDPGEDLLSALQAYGEVPLPPYITTALEDPERYQTTYARQPGSVAAPTAGLHLTSAVLTSVRTAGATVCGLELVVGLGTFRPIATDRVEDHRMHAERYVVPAATMDACVAADRVLAVGTTSLRALESVAVTGELAGRTELFIHGDHRFRVVDRLLTNFHQPRSSLLALVDAFVGSRWRDHYETALREGYRFLSFGDAMLLEGGRG